MFLALPLADEPRHRVHRRVHDRRWVARDSSTEVEHGPAGGGEEKQHERGAAPDEVLHACLTDRVQAQCRARSACTQLRISPKQLAKRSSGFSALGFSTGQREYGANHHARAVPSCVTSTRRPSAKRYSTLPEGRRCSPPSCKNSSPSSFRWKAGSCGSCAQPAGYRGQQSERNVLVHWLRGPPASCSARGRPTGPATSTLSLMK